MDVSVIIPTYNEERNIYELILKINEVISELKINFEIIVVDGNSKDNTQINARNTGARVIIQQEKGYGKALVDGFKIAKGEYIITMDADFSHTPLFIKDLWNNKENGEIIIASRYIKGGISTSSFFRQKLSIILNKIFTQCLHLPIKDISSGFRLYHKKILDTITIKSENYDVLEEIVIKIYVLGFKIYEIPFHYQPRKYGTSKAKLIKFAFSYLKTLYKMWKLRNSVKNEKK